MQSDTWETTNEIHELHDLLLEILSQHGKRFMNYWSMVSSLSTGHIDRFAVWLVESLLNVEALNAIFLVMHHTVQCWMQLPFFTVDKVLFDCSFAYVQLASGDAKINQSKREQKVLKMIELKCLEMKEMMLAQG